MTETIHEQPDDQPLPVLIIGAGPVGMMGALLLHQLGVSTRLIERRDGPIRAPAAHVVNARTFEICRGAGVDMDAMLAEAGDPVDSGHVVWKTRLAGEFVAQLPFERQDDAVLALTPTPLRNLGQHHFERVMHRTLLDCDAAPEYRKQWEGARREGDVVVSQIRDLATDEVEEIRSRYLLAADGAGSRVRKWLGIGMEGPPKLQTYVMVHFEADLRQYVADHPGIIFWLLDPEVTSSGLIAHDIDHEWVMMVAYDDETESVTDYPPERCEQIICEAIGHGEHPPIQIQQVGTWNMSAQVASHYRDGNVFLIGDSAHRFPPTGGLGLNSGVQDVHGLAWRLAAVLGGWAPESLLDSYEQERRPVAQNNTEQSLRNALKLVEVPQALGTIDDPTTGRMEQTLADTDGRARLVAAIENQAEHFDMLGLQLGFSYDDGAVVHDGSDPPPVDNPVREYAPTTRPGARLPHAWVDRDGERVSTLDLTEPGTFTLLTASPDSRWDDAAAASGDVPLRVVSFGRDVADIDSGWAAGSELEPDGAVLVRPDQHVGWRTTTMPADPTAALRSALGTIIGTRAAP